MKIKYQRFIDKYIENGGNATQAAIEAGYSPTTAYSQGGRLLKNVEIQNAINERMQEMDETAIAKDKEVLRFLTSVLRGEIGEQAVTPAGKIVVKSASVSDRLRAAFVLAKFYGLDRYKEPPAEPQEIRIVYPDDEDSADCIEYGETSSFM